MNLNPVKNIKQSRLKLLMIRQRYDRSTPFIVKKTFNLVVAISITYYVLTGLVWATNRFIQFCNGVGLEEIMAIMLNILLIAVSLATLGMITMMILTTFR